MKICRLQLTNLVERDYVWSKRDDAPSDFLGLAAGHICLQDWVLASSQGELLSPVSTGIAVVRSAAHIELEVLVRDSGGGRRLGGAPGAGEAGPGVDIGNLTTVNIQAPSGTCG